MKRRVEIISQQEIFKKFIFAIDEAHLRHEKFDGTMSAEITRLVFKRGDSVAALIYEEDTKKILLTEQFRFPTYEKGDGWMLELPAGVIEHKEEADPAETMRREITEEIGYQVKELRFIAKFYVSPGGTSERIFLYYAKVSSRDKTGAGGGLIEENEDIHLVKMDADEAVTKIGSGEIQDAKTIAALYWYALSKGNL